MTSSSSLEVSWSLTFISYTITPSLVGKFITYGFLRRVTRKCSKCRSWKGAWLDWKPLAYILKKEKGPEERPTEAYTEEVPNGLFLQNRPDYHRGSRKQQNSKCLIKIKMCVLNAGLNIGNSAVSENSGPFGSHSYRPVFLIIRDLHNF